MRQNLALSGAIITVLIPLAAFGVLGLATVVATHELAEIVVIANGIRAGSPHLPPRPPAGRSPSPLPVSREAAIHATKCMTKRFGVPRCSAPLYGHWVPGWGRRAGRDPHPAGRP